MVLSRSTYQVPALNSYFRADMSRCAYYFFASIGPSTYQFWCFGGWEKEAPKTHCPVHLPGMRLSTYDRIIVKSPSAYQLP